VALTVGGAENAIAVFNELIIIPTAKDSAR